MKLLTILVAACTLFSCSKSTETILPEPDITRRPIVNEIITIDTTTNLTYRRDTIEYDPMERKSRSTLWIAGERITYSYFYNSSEVAPHKLLYQSTDVVTGALNGTVTNYLKYDVQKRLSYDSSIAFSSSGYTDTVVHRYAYQGTSFIDIETSTQYGNNIDTVNQVQDQRGNIVHQEYWDVDRNKRVIDITYDNNPNPLFEISPIKSSNLIYPTDNAYVTSYIPQPNMFKRITLKKYTSPTAFVENSYEFVNVYNSKGYPISSRRVDGDPLLTRQKILYSYKD